MSDSSGFSSMQYPPAMVRQALIDLTGDDDYKPAVLLLFNSKLSSKEQESSTSTTSAQSSSTAKGKAKKSDAPAVNIKRQTSLLEMVQPRESLQKTQSRVPKDYDTSAVLQSAPSFKSACESSTASRIPSKTQTTLIGHIKPRKDEFEPQTLSSALNKRSFTISKSSIPNSSIKKQMTLQEHVAAKRIKQEVGIESSKDDDAFPSIQEILAAADMSSLKSTVAAPLIFQGPGKSQFELDLKDRPSYPQAKVGYFNISSNGVRQLLDDPQSSSASHGDFSDDEIDWDAVASSLPASDFTLPAIPNDKLQAAPQKEIRSVIVIARKSKKVSAPVIEKLRVRNDQLFQFFQVRIHPTLHACKPGICQVEFVSLTFNMMSSNTDMSTSRRKDLDELRQTLRRYDRGPNADNQEVAILCSNDDGLFTNAEGVAESFNKFRRINIALYIFLGDDKWERYGMNDLITAIADFRAKDYTKLTRSHHLLLKWVGISINKEMIAQAVRDLRAVLPANRNASRINLAPLREAPASSVRQYTSEAIQKRHSEAVRDGNVKNNHGGLIRYDLQTCDGGYECLLDECTETPKTLEELRAHLLAHCHFHDEFPMCIPDSDPEDTDLVKSFSQKYKGSAAQTEHILRHLPPTLLCPVDDCTYITTTEANMANHSRTHKGPRKRPCQCGYEDCDKSFASKIDLKRHQKVHGGPREQWPCECGAILGGKQSLDIHKRAHCRLRTTDVLHECPDCQEQFDKYDTLAKHRRAAHARPAQIIGFATSSGLLTAGMPGLGVDASSVVAASVAHLHG